MTLSRSALCHIDCGTGPTIALAVGLGLAGDACRTLYEMLPLRLTFNYTGSKKTRHLHHGFTG